MPPSLARGERFFFDRRSWRGAKTILRPPGPPDSGKPSVSLGGVDVLCPGLRAGWGTSLGTLWVFR